MTQIIETPWGPSQTSEEIASGIVRHDTASHGGYYLSPERVAEMPPALRSFNPFAGPNWYEEDCDWAVVALAFPQFFPLVEQEALASLKHFQSEVYREFTGRRAGMNQSPTKQQYKSILEREFSKYPWSKDPERYATAMAAVDRTLNGTTSCALTESWVLAWKELGLKGEPTYKALHALPCGEAV